MAGVRILRALWFFVTALMSALFIFFLMRGEALLSLASFLAGFAALLVINSLIRSEASREGIVLVDEMHYALAEKSAYLAFRAALLVIGAIVWITGIMPIITQAYLLPKHFSDPLNIGLGLSMAILVIAYYISYIYYSRARKIVEGR